MTTDSLVEAAKKSGLRITPAKKKLLQIFSENISPVTAAELLQNIDINKTSVYRAIDTLLSAGILTEVDFGDGKKRYELKEKDHHHHLICTRCKSVSEYPVSDGLEKLEKQIFAVTRFTVARHTLEFFGICRECGSL